MLYCAGYTVSFQEVPDEVSLVLLVSDCKHKCKGCHSPELWEKTGEVITREYIDDLLNRYQDAITCVCFMGEGESLAEACDFAKYIKDKHNLNTALYTGMSFYSFLESFDMVTSSFDYLKAGPYIKDLGGLDSPETNQQMFHIERYDDGMSISNITYRFQRKET